MNTMDWNDWYGPGFASESSLTTPGRRRATLLLAALAALAGLASGVAISCALLASGTGREGKGSQDTRNLAGGGVLARGPLAVHLARFLPQGLLPQALANLSGQAAADLDEGEHLFLPNRRTIWVVNRKTGRFANYHFKDDEVGTVERSRVVTLDKATFPPEDTVYVLSDRNLTEVLWVCNRRTGDVQLWVPRADGRITSDKPIATSIDLMQRTSSRSSSPSK
jgi:hypothetical protein